MVFINILCVVICIICLVLVAYHTLIKKTVSVPLKREINISVDSSQMEEALQRIKKKFSDPDYLFMHKLITESEWKKRCAERDNPFLFHHHKPKSMSKVILEDHVKAQIDVSVNFDDAGAPSSATGQKELVDGDEAPVPDGEPNELTITDAAKSNFADAVNTAKENYDAAYKAAEADLASQLVADNYTEGVFNTPAAN